MLTFSRISSYASDNFSSLNWRCTHNSETTYCCMFQNITWWLPLQNTASVLFRFQWESSLGSRYCYRFMGYFSRQSLCHIMGYFSRQNLCHIMGYSSRQNCATIEAHYPINPGICRIVNLQSAPYLVDMRFELSEPLTLPCYRFWLSSMSSQL